MIVYISANRRRAQPEGYHEADRDHFQVTAGEDLVHAWRDVVGYGALGEQSGAAWSTSSCKRLTLVGPRTPLK